MGNENRYEQLSASRKAYIYKWQQMLVAWASSITGAPKITGDKRSFRHVIVDYLRRNPDKKNNDDYIVREFLSAQVFVVRESFSKLMEGFDVDGDTDQGVRMPFDTCLFEFTVEGKRIICLRGHRYADDNTFNPDYAQDFIEIDGNWASLSHSGGYDDARMVTLPETSHIREFLDSEIRALCIFLEAEVAQRKVVRAPLRINENRRRLGKSTVADYFVIDLSKRARVVNPIVSASCREVRRHLRRGHWRHFQNHRTWIKWCVVRSDRAEFVEHHYAA